MDRAARILGIDAVIEGATGVALIVAPGLVAWLLFGTGLDGTGAIMARVAGMGLVGLGLACWIGRTAAPRAGLTGMLAYNLMTFVYLALIGFGPMAGILLWPAVAVHAAMAGFFLAALRPNSRENPSS